MAFQPPLQPGLSSAHNSPAPPQLPFPTLPEILELSRSQSLRLHTLGPFFRVTAEELAGAQQLRRAEGFIRPYFAENILHLDSIRMKRETLSMERSIFSLGFFVGAAAVRHGFDCCCSRTELLAINDSPLFHSRVSKFGQLVGFYTRMGFRLVSEVDGSSMGDLAHMLVWGVKGTIMDADIQFLLTKWSKRLKP
ncbi:hypothetical protein KSP40_PGU010498 [Platanthera guangdongensis]|uniref:Acyl-CoA N-acyltransferase n=1 Tax=Platanthera guangdongensis TaxID=2320717 RepID=A0ABR2M4K8_9ASPA